MRVAQGLYEHGYITYMRTDSVTLSGHGADRGPVAGSPSCTGPSTVPTRPAPTRRKVKNAQEAHEAIRPSGETFRTPASLPASCGATSGRSTTSSGSAPSPPR